MRTVTLLVLFLFLSVVTSYAEEIFLATLKNGNVLTWTNYQEQGNQYCTQKSYGMYCLDKKDVVSVKKEDDNPTGATVVHYKVSPQEKAQAEKDLQDSKKRQEDYLKAEERKEQEAEKKRKLEESNRKLEESTANLRRSTENFLKTLKQPIPVPYNVHIR